MSKTMNYLALVLLFSVVSGELHCLRYSSLQLVIDSNKSVNSFSRFWKVLIINTVLLVVYCYTYISRKDVSRAYLYIYR